jgi:hypothetical protein
VAYAVHYISANNASSWKSLPAGLLEAPLAAGAQLVVVVDVADETQVVASVPLLRGSGDASRLQQRRLEREFPGVLLTASLPVKKRPRESLADIVMVAADTSSTLTPQLEAFANRYALRGVYTPALLAAEWLIRAGQKHQQVLVVMPTPAGLRLIFIDNGRPLLSRLTESVGRSTAVEIGRTIQYLHNTQRASRETPVEIWFWGLADDEIQACLPSGESHRVGAAPKLPSLPNPELDGFKALLQLAASRPSASQLAPHRLRTGWYARKVKHWGYGVAAATLLVGIVSTAFLTSQTRDLRAQTATLKSSTRDFEASRASIESVLAKRGLKIDDLTVMPDAAAKLSSSEVTVREALGLAGRIFGARPEVTLTSLEFYSAPAAPSPDLASRTCAKELVAPVATVDAVFSLADSLDVRRAAESLAFIRTAMATPGPWRSTAASAAVGQLKPVSARAGSDHTGEPTEWFACLLRADST